jgi:hypothetical protein
MDPINKSNESMLTTIDNPYNPFTQFDDWYAFDVGMGYNTCSYLSRIAIVSEELSDADIDLAIERAIDEILELNLTGKYIKVTKDSFESRVVAK